MNEKWKLLWTFRKRSCEKFVSFIVVLETWGNFGKLFKIVHFFWLFFTVYTFFSLDRPFFNGCRSSAWCRNMDKGFTQRWLRWLAILKISSLISKALALAMGRFFHHPVGLLRPKKPKKAQTKNKASNGINSKRRCTKQKQGATSRNKNTFLGPPPAFIWFNSIKLRHSCAVLLGSWPTENARCLPNWRISTSASCHEAISGRDFERPTSTDRDLRSIERGIFAEKNTVNKKNGAKSPWMTATLRKMWKKHEKTWKKQMTKGNSRAIKLDFFLKMKTQHFFFGHRRILVSGDMECSSCPMLRDKARPLVDFCFGHKV